MTPAGLKPLTLVLHHEQVVHKDLTTADNGTNYSGQTSSSLNGSKVTHRLHSKHQYDDATDESSRAQEANEDEYNGDFLHLAIHSATNRRHQSYCFKNTDRPDITCSCSLVRPAALVAEHENANHAAKKIICNGELYNMY